MNTEAFKKYLATGEHTPTMDSAETDLEKHDRRFHPNGYKEGDHCNLREKLAEKDNADTVKQEKSFSKGEKVILKGNADRIGTITRIERGYGGRPVYWVEEWNDLKNPPWYDADVLVAAGEEKDAGESRENREKGDKDGGAKKIKTLVREWSLYGRSHDKPGPEVEFDEDDVLFVEACTSQDVPDDALTVYLYSKSNKPTLTVRYNDLLAISPKLAKEAKESHKRKVEAPDPLRGSPS